jgi:hypothetical protein
VGQNYQRRKKEGVSGVGNVLNLHWSGRNVDISFYFIFIFGGTGVCT